MTRGLRSSPGIAEWELVLQLQFDESLSKLASYRRSMGAPC